MLSSTRRKRQREVRLGILRLDLAQPPSPKSQATDAGTALHLARVLRRLPRRLYR